MSRHLLESDLAGEVKKGWMDECVVRKSAAHWQGRMTNGKRSHGEGQKRKKRKGRESFLKVGGDGGRGHVREDNERGGPVERKEEIKITTRRRVLTLQQVER